VRAWADCAKARAGAQPPARDGCGILGLPMQASTDSNAFSGIRARGIRAITLDLDDTLWPIWPTIERAERVLLQSTSRPEAWHEWFLEQGLHSANSYHGPRFDTFYMCVGAALSGCGVALVPRYLVEQELAEGKLVIPWPYAMRSSGAYFVAFAEHAAEVPKVRSLVEWIREQATAPRS